VSDSSANVVGARMRLVNSSSASALKRTKADSTSSRWGPGQALGPPEVVEDDLDRVVALGLGRPDVGCGHGARFTEDERWRRR